MRSDFSKVKLDLIGRSWLYTEREKKMICLEGLVWVNKNEHTRCLSFLKVFRCWVAFDVTASPSNGLFWITFSKTNCFGEMAYMYPFLNFFHIYFASVVFRNATTRYLLWRHKVVR